MRTLATVQHACARRGVRGLGLLQDHATREKLELRCKDEIRISTKWPLLAVLCRHRLHMDQGGLPITSRSDRGADIRETISPDTDRTRGKSHIESGSRWKCLSVLRGSSKAAIYAPENIWPKQANVYYTSPVILRGVV